MNSSTTMSSTTTEESQQDGTCPRDCKSWYDGCNTCRCNNGKIESCTERFCIRRDTPRCLDPVSNSTELAGTYWALTRANGTTISDPFDYTLSFDNKGKINGKNACNSYFGTYSKNSSTLTFRGLGETKMFCGNMEANLTKFLPSITQYRLTDVFSEKSPSSGRLTLYGRDGARHVFSQIVSGDVQKVQLEGGFYGVNVNGVKILLPELQTEFKDKNGHSYEFVGMEELLGYIGFYMWGTPSKVKAYRDLGPQVVPGRPLRVNGKIAKASSETSDCQSEWSSYPFHWKIERYIKQMSQGDKTRLGRAWRKSGESEHSSIASFAQVILELSSFGAPAELLQRTTSAMSDEVRHAKIMFSLASLALDSHIQVSGIELSNVTEIRSRPDFIEATIRDGCENETKAAEELAEEATKYDCPELRSLFMAMSKDERRHAALAYDTVAWMKE